MTMTTSACFIGLGNMGMPMAKNLLKNGVKLYVYNRTYEKTTSIIEAGATLLDSPANAFSAAPIVFSMLANDQALQEVSEKLLHAPKAGAIHVSMSTVSPDLSRRLAAMHQEKGVAFVAAPVFGRPDVAEKQSLWIVAAGSESAKKQVEPLLYFMGKKVYDFGADPGSANIVKITGNFLILSQVELLAEAFTLVEKGGVSVEAFHSFLTDSLFPSPVIQTYGGLIRNRKFMPAGFKLALGLKDIDLFLKAAHNLRVPSPIGGLLRDRLLSAIANNRGDMDWSAIALSSLEQAGLETRM
jgi:3-hydroxyisobutyrate dehydrogenase-like beta-hydroxyacid dehydrogenase